MGRYEPVWRWWTRRGTVDEHADVSGGGDVRDDELEDPQGCIDPWTGDTVPRGSAVIVPVAYPMPPGTLPATLPGPGGRETYGLYVCEGGHWIGIDAWREDLIELLSDEVSVDGLQGAPVMTGTCRCADESVVELSASVGSVELDEDGSWTWQLASDDGPVDDEVVVITATTRDKTTKVAFALTRPERSVE